MNPAYEFWLCDDAGVRITLLKDFSFASFSRSTRGLGTILFGLPLDAYIPYVPIIFQPDWRIDAYRSPGYGIPKRREGSFLLRKFNIYDRTEDNLRMIEFYGRSPLDLIRRWSMVDPDPATYEITDHVDDIMKLIVNDIAVFPAGEFSVDADLGLGPIVSQSFFGKNALDVITDLKATSFYLNFTSSTNRRIFFDVIEGPGLINGFGYIFRTYADLRGTDRTKGVVFSTENGNLNSPSYFEDYLDEVTIAQIGSTIVYSPDRYLSRWNQILEYQNIISTDAGVETSRANQILANKEKKLSLTANLLNTPGSSSNPRSLYGVDWDLGDLVPVQYANKNFTAEIEIVWISVNDQGEENIVGQNKVGLQ